MDKKEFETVLFNHMKKESLVLTPVNAGMVTGIDSIDAAALLEELCNDGKITKTSGSGTSAIYRKPGESTWSASPGEKAVSSKRSHQAVYHLIFNALFPGLGSLFYGKISLLVLILLFLGGAISMIVLFPGFAKIYSVLMLFFAWVISFLGGIYYYQKDPWSLKKD